MATFSNTLLRQCLESMLKFFASNSPVWGGSLLTDGDLTTAQVIARALKGEVDVRESVAYRGYIIKPRLEMSWPTEDRYGYWVTQGIINVMPGACWFRTVQDARKGIDDLELAKGEADTFWLLTGAAGLTVTNGMVQSVSRVRSQFAPGVVVTRQNDHVLLQFGSETGHVLRAKEALALSVMLKDAAERALGKTI